MLNVQYEAPDEKLAKWVSSFYRLDYDGPGFQDVERADRAQFRFNLVGEGEFHFATDFVTKTFPVTISGPTTGPVTVDAYGPITVFGWGMTPAGWAALMGRHGEDRIDTAFDGREIFGGAIMELRDRLIDCSNFAAQLAVGIHAAEMIFNDSDEAIFDFTKKVDDWLNMPGDPDINSLILATGLSLRQLERTTKRYYGMPPKRLARKYRALKAAVLLAHGDSLDDTDLGISFYDQSHLIRELKQFTGLTPSQLRKGSSELTHATMQGRRELGAKVSTLISGS